MPIRMTMAGLKNIVLLSLLLYSCAIRHSRTPANNPIDRCKSALSSIISNTSLDRRSLTVPQNTARYQMLTQYIGENSLDLEIPVIYLDKTQRAQYEIFINSDGLIVDQSGEPLTSPLFGNRPREAIYVVSPEGKIYISYQTPFDNFYHSSFLSGGDVIGAGLITFHKGTIQTLSNESGHYHPPMESLKTLMTLFAQKKVQIMNVFAVKEFD